jgi:hypothetical protein
MNTLIQVWETYPISFLLVSGAFAVLFSVGYLQLADDAVEVIIAVRSWANPDTVCRPQSEDIDLLRLLWPLALVFDVFVYGLIGIIKRAGW